MRISKVTAPAQRNIGAKGGIAAIRNLRRFGGGGRSDAGTRPRSLDSRVA